MLVLMATLAFADAPADTPADAATSGIMDDDNEGTCTPTIRRQVAPRFPPSERGYGADCTVSIFMDEDGNAVEAEFVEGECPIGFQPTTAAAASRFRFRLPTSCEYNPDDKPKFIAKFKFVPSRPNSRERVEALTEAYIAQVVDAYTQVEGPTDSCEIGATVYANGSIAGLTRNLPQCLAVVGSASAPTGLQQATTCTLTAEVGNDRARKWAVSGCPEGIGQAALDIARGWRWHNPYPDRIPYELQLTFDPSSPE